VFIGGGLAIEGEARPLLYYYDIPEWGVMLANSWRSFRSYPWAMIYPALAFMIAIVTFTLLGEGLRRMAEELTLSMKALFNKYTFAAAAVVALLVWWGFQSTGIWARYKPLANTFDAERAMQDVETLASPEFEGRQIGTPGGDAAADWIAQQFEELGLVTAGEDWTYFQTIRTRIATITEPSTLQAWDVGGNAVPLAWGQDYREAPERRPREGDIIRGDIVYASAKGLDYFNVSAVREALGISEEEAQRTDKILLVDEKDKEIGLITLNLFSGNRVIAAPSGTVLIINDDVASAPYRDLPGITIASSDTTIEGPPVFYITSDAADRLLSGSGYTLADLRRESAVLQDGQGLYVRTGDQMEVHLSAAVQTDTTYRNVLAIWPGEDVALDEELIAISAYYDGLGTFGDVLYPGANDNASGVATMLELIRSWKESGFKPKRSILFAAWAGGELNQMPSITHYLGARPGMDELKIIGTFEVEGVGAGEGDAALLWRSNSERVSGMVQTAARKLGLPLTTSGAGLHSAKLSTFEVQSTYPILNLGWPGTDANTHLPTDTPNTLDPNKIESVGRILSLVASVMASDPAY